MFEIEVCLLELFYKDSHRRKADRPSRDFGYPKVNR